MSLVTRRKRHHWALGEWIVAMTPHQGRGAARVIYAASKRGYGPATERPRMFRRLRSEAEAQSFIDNVHHCVRYRYTLTPLHVGPPPKSAFVLACERAIEEIRAREEVPCP